MRCDDTLITVQRHCESWQLVNVLVLILILVLSIMAKAIMHLNSTRLRIGLIYLYLEACLLVPKTSNSLISFLGLGAEGLILRSERVSLGGCARELSRGNVVLLAQFTQLACQLAHRNDGEQKG